MISKTKPRLVFKKTKTPQNQSVEYYLKSVYDRSQTIVCKSGCKTKNYHPLDPLFLLYRYISIQIYLRMKVIHYLCIIVHWKYALPWFIDNFGCLSSKSQNWHSAVDGFLSLKADLLTHPSRKICECFVSTGNSFILLYYFLIYSFTGWSWAGNLIRLFLRAPTLPRTSPWLFL